MSKQIGFNTEVEISGNQYEIIQRIRCINIAGITFGDIDYWENMNGMYQSLEIEYFIDQNIWGIENNDFEKVYVIDDYVQCQIERCL